MSEKRGVACFARYTPFFGKLSTNSRNQGNHKYIVSCLICHPFMDIELRRRQNIGDALSGVAVAVDGF